MMLHGRRGSVDAFNYLATQHPEVQQSLVGRTIIFGQKSGITVKGKGVFVLILDFKNVNICFLNTTTHILSIDLE